MQRQVITPAGQASGIQATSLLIGGRVVEFDPAVVGPAGGLGDGVHARVEGEVLSAGRLRARAIRVRSAAGAGGQNVELRGNVTALSGDGRRFAVRGVAVAMPEDVARQQFVLQAPAPGGPQQVEWVDLLP